MKISKGLKSLTSKLKIASPLLLSLSVAFSLPSMAQGQEGPEARVLDENGVNLLTGTLEGQIPLISIGSGAGALSHSSSILGSGATGQSLVSLIGIDIFADNGVYDYYVFLPGGEKVRFESTDKPPTSNTVFTEYVDRNNSLQFSNGVYTFKTPDGTVFLFDQYGTSRANARTITSPDGTTLTYNWLDYRMSSVRSNLGYQLKFEYPSSSKTKIKAINNTIEYCSPTARSCNVGTQWSDTEVTKNNNATGNNTGVNTTTFDDAMDRRYQTNVTIYPNGTTKHLIDFPGDVQYGYAQGIYQNGRLVQASRNGLSNGYSYIEDDKGTSTEDDDELTTTVQYPDNSSRTVVSKVKGNLILSDTNVLGQTTSYSYTSDNRISTITYPRGDRTEYIYDSRGNITETRNIPVGGGTPLVTKAGFPTSCTTSNRKYCNKPSYTINTAGHRTDYQYHAASGNVSQILAPAPTSGQARPKTTFNYVQKRAKVKNSSGSHVNAAPIWKLSSKTSLAGTSLAVTTTYTYNVYKNLAVSSVTTSSGSLSQKTTMEYDNFGNMIHLDGPISGTTDKVTYRYDDLRRRTGQIGADPDGGGSALRQAQRVTYDLSGYISKTESGLVSNWYASSLNSMSVTQSQNYKVNSAGRVETTYLKAGNAIIAQQDYNYNNRGRVKCTATRMNPNSLSGSYSDACTANAAGSYGPDRISKREYDVAGRLTSTTSAFGTSAASTTSMNYYSYGPLKEIFDGEGNKTYYTYDHFNRNKEIFYPNKSGNGHNGKDYVRYSYDNAGRQYNTRQRDGQTVTKSYDALGRTTFLNVPGTSEDTTFSYDLAGRPLSVQKSGQTLSYTYDNFGRMLSETSSVGTVSYVYDSHGRRTRMNYPGAGGFYVTYEYLSGGLLKSIKEKGNTTLASYTYDSHGRRKTITRGTSNNVTTYNYGTVSRLTSITNNLSGTSADQTLSFTYAPSGQIATKTNSNTAFDPTTTAFDNDYIINGLNQLTKVNNSTLTYDEAGNMLTGGGSSYSYDYANRLTSVSGKGSLTYDPVSRLRTLTANGTTTNFTYDGQDMIMETSGSTVLKRYVHGPSVDEPLVEYTGSGTSNKKWLVADALGSITGHANSSGTSLAINHYDPYGQPQSGNEGRFQYTGQIWLEELELYYYKARFYDPTLRRFLTTDPLGYGDGMNMYAYVSGDPINSTDPSGLCSFYATYTTYTYSTNGSGPTPYRRFTGFAAGSDCYDGPGNGNNGNGIPGASNGGPTNGGPIRQPSDIRPVAPCGEYDREDFPTEKKDTSGDKWGSHARGPFGSGLRLIGPFSTHHGAVKSAANGINDMRGGASVGATTFVGEHGYYHSIVGGGIGNMHGSGLPTKAGIFTGIRPVSSVVAAKSSGTNSGVFLDSYGSPFVAVSKKLIPYSGGDTRPVLKTCY